MWLTRAWLAYVASLGLVSLVSGQAFFGDSTGGTRDTGTITKNVTCPSQIYRYLGCFTGDLSYAFRPQFYTKADPTLNYPGWDPGSIINNTVVPLYCSNVCRGFGYRYAALFNGLTCSCGFSEPSSGLSTSTLNCNSECGGDITRTCGGSGATDVYADPSFAGPSSLTGDGATLATRYTYLGCFYKPNYPTMDSAVMVTNQASQAACLSHCSSNGYPMAHMSYNTLTRYYCRLVISPAVNGWDILLTRHPVTSTATADSPLERALIRSTTPPKPPAKPSATCKRSGSSRCKRCTNKVNPCTDPEQRRAPGHTAAARRTSSPSTSIPSSLAAGLLAFPAMPA